MHIMMELPSTSSNLRYLQVRINDSVIVDGAALESATSGSFLLPSKSIGPRPSADPTAQPAAASGRTGAHKNYQM